MVDGRGIGGVERWSKMGVCIRAGSLRESNCCFQGKMIQMRTTQVPLAQKTSQLFGSFLGRSIFGLKAISFCLTLSLAFSNSSMVSGVSMMALYSLAKKGMYNRKPIKSMYPAK